MVKNAKPDIFCGILSDMDYQKNLRASFPDEVADGILSAQSREASHCLILNQNKLSIEELLNAYPNLVPHPFVDGAFYYEKSEYDLGKSFFHDLGGFYIQDASAMMSVYFLNPKPGDLILDFAAAPGGKTIDAALLTSSQATILSNDISYPRALEESKNIEHLGIRNCLISAADLSKPFSFLHERFDKIILDAPCSGSAMFRKEKAMERDWSYRKVESLSKTQKELLEIAFSYLRQGGTISYSTCSFSYEENEGVILDFLSKHDDAEIVSLPAHPSFYRHKDLPQAIHFLPHLFKGEGQFVCLLRKKGVGTPAPLKKLPPDKIALARLKEAGINVKEREIPINVKGSIYLTPEALCAADLWKLNIIRPGVKACEISSKGDLTMDLHLARSLPNEESIPLSSSQASAYLHGDTFPLQGPSGFRIVSYKGMNLGWVKLVNGMAKNHYPKGLRRQYLL